MKLGILTYHNALNYGAVLQTWALQQFLRKNTDETSVQIIDYRSPGVEKQYRFQTLRESGSLRTFLHVNLTVFLQREKMKNFARFSDQFFEKTARIRSLSDKEIQDMDSVIIGSDQVWNPSCTSGDPAFLGAGLSETTVKVSYAASMGACGKIDEFHTKYGIDYAAELKKFRALSCREEDAAEWITENLSLPCTSVMDPVLLHDRKEWKYFAESSAEHFAENTAPYIFVYNLGNFPVLAQLASKIREKTGYRVIAVSRNFRGDLMYRSCERKSNIGPQEFLYLLSHAAVVVSDSFHATAFAILFECPFYSVGSHSKENTNSRLKNILRRYGLENRYVTEVSDGIFAEEKPDFSVAAEMLTKDREAAGKWLLAALE